MRNIFNCIKLYLLVFISEVASLDLDTCITPEPMELQNEGITGQCDGHFDSPHSNKPEMAVVLYREENILPLHKKERNFRYVERDIRIRQDWSGLGVAAVVWDAAETLSKYLEQHPDIVRGKHVIELGAGTGLVGIVAALLGAKITITDRREVIDYLENMVKTNLPEDLYQQTAVVPLDWTKDLDTFNKRYDVILGADIVYIEQVFDDLIKTLIKLSDQNSVVLLSCRIRYDRDSNFLTRLEESFYIDKVLYDESKDVNLYRLTKRYC